MAKRQSDEWALRIQLEKEEARVAELQAENERLRADLLEAKLRSMPRQRQQVTGGISDRDLRDLIVEFHPDRNPGGLSPTAVTAALNRLREKVRA